MSTQSTVLIIGAGTMGAGIAQVAASAGWRAILTDVDDITVDRAIDGVIARLDRMAEKGRMTIAARDEAVANLFMHSQGDDLSSCDLIIEAVVEDLSIKTNVLEPLLPMVSPDTIIATNTSSLSISKLGARLGEEHRTIGMHFFNPAPLMKLVEVVAGENTDELIVDRVAAIAEAWGKVVARTADVPGFIVNHVARPYYLEAFRMLEDGVASPSVIDSAMRDGAGFRMGPFELTDLIGQDVNTATTRSVWEQLDHPPLLTPSAMQEQLVQDGALGRKTGAGVYHYAENTRAEAMIADAPSHMISERAAAAAHSFCERADLAAEDSTTQYIIARIMCAFITQARLAAERGVATSDAIDTALKFGVNYPRGPFEVMNLVGEEHIGALAAALDAEHADPRFVYASAHPSGTR